MVRHVATISTSDERNSMSKGTNQKKAVKKPKKDKKVKPDNSIKL